MQYDARSTRDCVNSFFYIVLFVSVIVRVSDQCKQCSAWQLNATLLIESELEILNAVRKFSGVPYCTSHVDHVFTVVGSYVTSQTLLHVLKLPHFAYAVTEGSSCPTT